MASADSALDPAALARARKLLATPTRVERFWPVLGAAAFAAVSALALAAATIMAPAPEAKPLMARDSNGQMVPR